MAGLFRFEEAVRPIKQRRDISASISVAGISRSQISVSPGVLVLVPSDRRCNRFSKRNEAALLLVPQRHPHAL
jgi:hypothetical protein